jgi:hypothetical protein
MTDTPGLLLPTSPSHSTYHGFVRVPGRATSGPGGGESDAWVRLEGVKTKAGGGDGRERGQLLRHARLVLGPDLEAVLQVR